MVGGKRSLGVACLLAGSVYASAGVSAAPITVKAYSHPNGAVSADTSAVDDRDYGLRLDTVTGINTFAFDDVDMIFYDLPITTEFGDAYARLTGTIVHLQSSDAGTLGYSGSSGLDDEDQRWTIEATFRNIGTTGSWMTEAAVPYSNMLDDLLGDGSQNSSERLSFALSDVILTPEFDEGLNAAVFDGARAWDERPGSDPSPNDGAFYVTPRHRLNPGQFASPDWDVLAAAGWLEPANDAGTNYTNDFLFTLGAVPEPATVALLLSGGFMAVRRRR